MFWNVSKLCPVTVVLRKFHEKIEILVESSTLENEKQNSWCYIINVKVVSLYENHSSQWSNSHHMRYKNIWKIHYNKLL